MRLDLALREKGITESRSKAKFIIKKGKVLVNGSVVKKPSKKVSRKDELKINEEFEYVGRGSYKIDFPAKKFNIDFNDKIILDVGCSVGGFTDYALKNGAKKVYSIDTGDNINKKLRRNQDVFYFPNTNIIDINSLPEKIDLCLIDVTFISVKKVIPTISSFINDNGKILSLVKPPFEVENKVKKINDYGTCLKIAKDVYKWCEKEGFKGIGLCDSKLLGKGSQQQEFFIFLKK